MNPSLISSDIKTIIEGNPVAVATVTPEGNPNVIGVAFVKVVDGNKILITDNFMNQTIKDITHNPRIAIVGWNGKMVGYKLLGNATYYAEGEWVEKAKLISENKGMPVKGVILVSVEKVIKSS